MIAKIGQTLTIGARPEHNARAYEFDVAKWRRMWPEATAINVIVQRPGDKEAYPAVSSVDGDTVTWTVTRYDTDRPGVGKMRVAFVNGVKLLGLTPETAIIVQEGLDMVNGDTPASDTPPWIQMVLDAIAGFKPGEGGNGTPGEDGEDGATFYPSVSADGTLSWTNDKGLENPKPVNIKGEDGDPGVAISDTEPTDPDVHVWINPNGDADPLVTAEDITGALGYTPANQEDVNSLSEEIKELKGVTTTRPFEVTGANVSINPVEGSALGVVAKIAYKQVPTGNGIPSMNNVMPISGVDSVVITHRNATEQKAYTIQLPETGYIGTLDVTTGTLTLTHKMIERAVADMNNGENYPGWTGVTELEECYGKTLNGTLTDYVSNVTYYEAGTARVSANLTSSSKVLFLSKGTFGTQSQLMANYPNLVMQFLCPLLEPKVLNVEPQQIIAMAGTNHISASSGNVTVSGTEEVTVGGMGSTDFDPTAYNLPILSLDGDVSTMTKDNAVDLAYRYDGKSGTCSVKWQGSSSLAYPKKNYTIKFDQAFEAKTGWGEQKKYCLKANWIDFSHSRNVVNALLWGRIVASRNPANETLADCPNYGAVDGFPVCIMLNGEFMGVYTFNIPKDAWMMNMGSGTNEAILCAGNACPTNFFKAPATLIGENDLEIEYITNEDDTAWAVTSVNNLINACINSDGTDLDTTIATMLDWESAIDYYIFVALLRGDDMVGKNYLLNTYDGTKWFFGAYDMDCTYGLHWDGSKWLNAGGGMTIINAANAHRVFELIKTYKTDALKARYSALRSGALNENIVAELFWNFYGGIPKPMLDEDNRKWPGIPNTSVNNVYQILEWYRRRVIEIDKQIEAL